MMFRLFESALDPTEKPAGSEPPARLVAFYWHFIRQTKGWYAAMFAASLAVALLDTVIPLFIGGMKQGHLLANGAPFAESSAVALKFLRISTTGQLIMLLGALLLTLNILVMTLTWKLGLAKALFAAVTAPLETSSASASLRRDQQEVNLGHIPGALHISRGTMETKIEAVISRDAEVVIYCASGNRRALAAVTPLQMGLQKGSSLAGGFRGWAEAGGDVDG